MTAKFNAIENLLKKFDDLSKLHTSILLNFQTVLPDVKNPLRNIERTADEQRKTKENVLLIVDQSETGTERILTLEGFHRHIIKSRYLNRPPCYTSNDDSITTIPTLKSSPTTFERNVLPSATNEKKVPIIYQQLPMANTSNIRSKVQLTGKIKVIPHLNVVPTARRPPVRHKVTEFSIETVNRLSKPKMLTKRSRNFKSDSQKSSKLPSTSQSLIDNISNKRIPLKKYRSHQKPEDNTSSHLTFLSSTSILTINFPKDSKKIVSRSVSSTKPSPTHKLSMISIRNRKHPICS